TGIPGYLKRGWAGGRKLFKKKNLKKRGGEIFFKNFVWKFFGNFLFFFFKKSRLRKIFFF
ncbi:hypothetical protein, partial [Streptococcus uberis]|uniref:hypothetical protein n=1 Tax=Streptococcus uberis TaxID=1349 RepID=UPI001E3BC1A0